MTLEEQIVDLTRRLRNSQDAHRAALRRESSGRVELLGMYGEAHAERRVMIAAYEPERLDPEDPLRVTPPVRPPRP